MSLYDDDDYTYTPDPDWWEKVQALAMEMSDGNPDHGTFNAARISLRHIVPPEEMAALYEELRDAEGGYDYGYDDDPYEDEEVNDSSENHKAHQVSNNLHGLVAVIALIGLMAGVARGMPVIAIFCGILLIAAFLGLKKWRSSR